jgi:tricorn protease
MDKYILYPDIRDKLVVFVNDNDLWKYNLENNSLERLTNSMGIVASPKISPDGKIIYFRLLTGKSAYSSDIYSINIENGKMERITYLSGNSTSKRIYTSIAGFGKEGNLIILTDAYYPFGTPMLYNVKNRHLYPLNLGPASNIIYNKDYTILGRNTFDLPQWKRYKGGTRGKILSGNKGNFKIIIDLESNVNSPMLVDNRIYFISDHEGSGNIYSTDMEGKGIKKHTDFDDYYVRNANSDGKRIIFQKNGSVFIMENNKTEEIKIDIKIPSVNIESRIIKATDYMSGYCTNYSGDLLAFISRGQAVYSGINKGPVYCIDKLKNQLISFMNNDDLIIYRYNETENSIFIYSPDKNLKSTFKFDEGIIIEIKASPDNKKIAFSDNRFGLYLIDIDSEKIKKIDESDSGEIEEFSWSSDSNLLAYSYPETKHFLGDSGSNSIKIYCVSGDKKYIATTPGSVDFSPVFDPDGNYLYYLSKRSLDPVGDELVLDLGYPAITKPYAIPLRKNVGPLFYGIPQEFRNVKPGEYKFDGLAKMSQVFPVPTENYTGIIPVKEGVILFHYPVEGSMKYYPLNNGGKTGKLSIFNFKTEKMEDYDSGVVDYAISGNNSYLIISKPENKIIKRSIETKTDEDINMDRFSIKAFPEEEWKNMLFDAYNLIRENYWSKEKAEKLGSKPYNKYKKLLGKITARFELSDLIREMQGEYSTSHSYEIGGDLSESIPIPIGKLGIDYTYNNNVYSITKIYSGDISNENEKSPLLYTDIMEGDIIISIAGQELNDTVTPEMALLNHSNEIVSLKIQRGKALLKYYVKTLEDEKYLRYREFVENNRNYVHEKTDGKIGYLHIPDMGMNGFNEFFRLYAQESSRDGLIVDMRFNGGGFVSQLLMEKLARKRIGYDVPRRGIITPYPIDSVDGPMIAITNEYAGSDGDIGAHVFKLFNLGEVVGTRSWGGVVGANPKIRLVDNTTVTQPQFATWFKDVKYGLENYGTEPDIYTEYMPQDFLKNNDAQLNKALDIVLKNLKSYKKLELKD